MSFLILVKHAMPVLDPQVPASRWLLSDEGRRQAGRLAERLSLYQPARLVASLEPKAAETGQIIAAALGLRAEPLEGLHEHRREQIGWITPAQMQQGVADLFAHPDETVFGEESANAAYHRFAESIAPLLAAAGNTVVVSHGTVISLYVSRLTGAEPYPLWERLGLPACVVLSLSQRRIEAIIEHV